MPVGKLSEHLRYLISEAKKATDAGRRSYHSCLEGNPSLNDLSGEVFAASSAKGRGPRLSSKQLFSLQLLKKIILTRFELLCVSAELQDDVEYAFGECRCLCEHIVQFNAEMESQSQKSSHHSKYLQFADFTDVAISTQTRLLLKSITSHPSVKTIISLAKFEHHFITALAAIFATYTSLFLPSIGSQKLKTVYVSEEMFSMAQNPSSTSTLSWLDCLIPGAQSEVLRLTVREMLARLWGRVALHLVAALQPLTVDRGRGGEGSETVVTLLRDALKHPDLDHHTAVKKCLWYTLSSIEHQQGLSKWDQGFQAVLVMCPQDTRKNFKPSKSSSSSTNSSAGTHCTPSMQRFIARVLSPLLETHSAAADKPLPESTTKAMLLSSEAISYHVDELRLSLVHTAAVQRSAEHIARYLIQGLRKSLASENTRSIGQLLMVDGCSIVSSLSSCLLRLAQSSSPRYLLPPCSRLHLTECLARAAYALAYHNYTKLKDSLEQMCVAFHDRWQGRCGQLLQASFPTTKFWKSLNKSRSPSQEPGSYCNLLIEELLLPAMEAGRGIADQKAQLAFLLLTINVFLNGLRKTITANRHTYSPSCGRQLLVDFRHVRRWLLSPDLSLPQPTTELLSNLPALGEMERGLLEVCGTADKMEADQKMASPPPPPDWGQLWSGLPYASQLCVCWEYAWAKESDWTNCAL